MENLETILSSKSAVIDLSKISPLFQNKFLEYIYTKINPTNTQVILEASNTISKKSLKTVIIDSEVSTTLAVNSKFQYLNAIKDMFKNFIIESTVSNNEIFKVYCTFLSSMQNGMYLISGENVNYIPMVSKIQEIDETIETIDSLAKMPDSIEEEIEQTVEDEVLNEVSQPEEKIEQVEEVPQQEDVLSEEEIIAEIEEKSNDVIDTISENIEQPVEIDLFGDSDDAEDNTSEETEDTYNNEIEPEVEQTSSGQEAELLDVEPENIISGEEELQEQGSTDEISDEQDVNNDSSVNIETEEPLDIQTEDDVFVLQETELEEEPPTDAGAVEDDTLLESTAEELLAVGDSTDDIESVANLEDIQDFTSDDENILSGDNEISELQLDTSDETDDEDITIDLTDDEEALLQEEPLQITEDTQNQIDEPEMDILEPSILPLDGSEYNQEFEELDEAGEFNADESKEDDVVINLENESDFVEIDEDVDRQIVEDVDKVFTTMKNDDELEEISDSDLDLIDELNSDDDELEEYNAELEEISDSKIEDGILDQPQESIIPPRQPHQENNEILEKKEANTPIVPVYDADIPQEDMVVSDTIQQGDSVVHAKYGNGVVEKMIKYGTKTLFSINFENIGRRLLDPTLTEIKKL